MNLPAMDEKIATLLLASLHQDRGRVSADHLADLSPLDWQSLLALAGAHKVRPLLYHRLKTRSLEQWVPADVMSVLQKAYWNTAQRNLSLYGELNHLVSDLGVRGIRVIPLKGAFLAGRVYESLALREMADLDLLIAPDQLEKAAKVLEARGYAPRLDFTLAVSRARQHDLPRFSMPGVAEVELHWNITKPDTADAVDPVELWERAIPVRIAGVDVMGLCTEDLLLHLCFHAAYHHSFALGLRPLYDITELLRCHGRTVGWSAVVERAGRWRCKRGVYLVLRLAKELAGASVPDEVLADLQPVDLHATIATAARAHILTEPETASAMSQSFVELWETTAPARQVGTFLHRLLLPKTLMAHVYAVPPDSPRVYLYYAVRFRDMLARYWRKALSLWFGDPTLTLVAQHQALLVDWLAEDGKAAP